MYARIIIICQGKSLHDLICRQHWESSSYHYLHQTPRKKKCQSSFLGWQNESSFLAKRRRNHCRNLSSNKGSAEQSLDETWKCDSMSKNTRVSTKELYYFLTPWFQQLRISFAFYLRLLIFVVGSTEQQNLIFLIYFLNVLCVKKLQLMIC